MFGNTTIGKIANHEKWRKGQEKLNTEDEQWRRDQDFREFHEDCVLMGAIAKLSEARPQYTWYVRCEAPWFERSHGFCRLHAEMVSRIHALTHAADVDIDMHFGESDSAERCEFHGCDAPLSNGGITSYGVDSALGITETDPYNVHVYPAELELAARAMSRDDHRWVLWRHHARRVIAKAKAKARRRPRR